MRLWDLDYDPHQSSLRFSLPGATFAIAQYPCRLKHREDSFVQNASASGSGCPNFPVAPSLTIRNGVAQFAALYLTYQGYVTPQGEVRMQTPEGRTFVGQIDP